MVNYIIESLEMFADERRLKFAANSHPTQTTVLGVTVPNVKLVLKELQKGSKGLEPHDKIQLAKDLVRTNIFECNQLALEYLGLEKEALISLSKSDLSDLSVNLDNWVLVDTFSLSISGALWREQKITIEDIKEYLSQDDLWLNRVAVVSTVALNLKARGGKGDINQTIAICKLVVDDHRPLMYKALSWSLRELSKYDKNSVEEFIDLYGLSIHKSVLKEVTNKLYTGRKNL